MLNYSALIRIGFAIFLCCYTAQLGQSNAETTRSMLAAQIRSQGFACEKAIKASRDSKRSRPDLGVWVLRCSNATYLVSRAPDMPAKVEPLP